MEGGGGRTSKSDQGVCYRVGIDPLGLVSWMQNLRMWISQTVLVRVVAEIDDANRQLARDELYKNRSSRKTGCQFNWLKNRLKNHLRSKFDSVTCLNYQFLVFSQHRKSQVIFQVVFQAIFQAVFKPIELAPCILTEL